MQKRTASVELGGHHPQSADDTELHTPATLPQVCGALLQGVVPHGSGGAALVPGGAAAGAVLFITALCWKVIPGEGAEAMAMKVGGLQVFVWKEVV